MVRRLESYGGTFSDEDPTVFILAPSQDRPVPAGDPRRGTAWVFQRREEAERFAAWMAARHGVTMSPVEVRLRMLTHTLQERDLTWVLNPEPKMGYGNPFSFKAPLTH